ncbi:hypothetical protein HDR70_03505 [bacterium]|nr:hypothetical protein [bacterium]
MTNIYIESKNLSTPEAVFLTTFLGQLGIDAASYNIIPLNGKDNLRNARNQFIQNTLEEGLNLIIFDADTSDNLGGYRQRKEYLEGLLNELGMDAEIFLFPNNADDGDFETLLEGTTRRNSFRRFFDCFEDYELCLGDEYVHPNRKGKLHTYITSMKLSNAQRKKIGSGFWLFDEDKYWDLHADALSPLADFLRKHLS